VEPFSPLPASLYAEGARCATLPLKRITPHAKDTRFIASAQDAYGRLPAGIEEGLLVAEDGSILEGLSSNFFGVSTGALRTEGERVLQASRARRCWSWPGLWTSPSPRSGWVSSRPSRRPS
jgi:hypothetical protein